MNSIVGVSLTIELGGTIIGQIRKQPSKHIHIQTKQHIYVLHTDAQICTHRPETNALSRKHVP